MQHSDSDDDGVSPTLAPQVTNSSTEKSAKKKNGSGSKSSKRSKAKSKSSSAYTILQNNLLVRRTIRKVYSASSQTSMLRQGPRTQSTDGPTLRSFRLIRPQLLQVLSAGAALNVNNTIQNECKALGIDVKDERKRSPWVPTVMRSSAIEYEQFLTAIAQEVVNNAKKIREQGSHKRIDHTAMDIAINATINSIFGPGMFRNSSSATYLSEA